MEEMRKEIESLRRKTFYLILIIVTTLITFAGIGIRQTESYSKIQSYYLRSLENDRNLNQELIEMNRLLETSISKIQ